MKIEKPMLAETLKNFDDLKYPVIASPKLDGIRAFIKDGKLVSRTGKPIKNTYVRNLLEGVLGQYEGIDGELMVPGTFQDVSHGIMSEEGFPDFYYNIFDWASDRPYEQRVSEYENLCISLRHSKIKAIDTRLITSKEALLAYEEKVLSEGYEGVMVRAPRGPYKQGRSTLKEQYLLKIKRFKDSEAVILGFVEGQTNTNLAKKNEVGHTKRSTCKEGMLASGTLGAFTVQDVNTKLEFEIGTGVGLTQELRQAIWNDQKSYLNKTVKYKFFEIGTKDLPRFPSFQGFRDPEDQ